MNDSLILTLCLQENTILISNAVIEQLGSPSLIQIRMNEADKSLLITPCEYGIRGAVVVPDNHQYQLEMPGRSLIRRIQRITEWQDDNPRVLYGVFIPQHNAIYFSLDTAQYAILQPAPGTQENSTTDTTTDDSMSSTLPSREGMEAVMQPAPYEANKRTGEVDNRTGVTVDKADVPADGKDGDLNG